MYENIGRRIKGLAVVIAVIEAVVGSLGGIIMIFTDEDLILSGLLVIAVSCLFAWSSSWLLYGFASLYSK